MKKLRNLINNTRRYGVIGVLKFYINNILFGEQIDFNTFKFIEYLKREFCYPYFKFHNKINKEIIKFEKIFIPYPKISIIMSVFNDEENLEESIESVLEQNFKDFEFLIVDDCSRDSSYEILKYYKSRDNRIKLFKNKDNLGLTKSLNFLLSKAKGKYIARMDSDDICLKDRIKKQYRFLERNMDIFLIGGGSYNINYKGLIVSKFEPPTGYKEIKKELPIKNCIYHPTIMFRNMGYEYREKFIYSQDYDFYLNLLSRGKKLRNFKEPLIKYRLNPKSITYNENIHQGLFAEQARIFYRQRNENKQKRDKYNNFEPKYIFEGEIFS